MCALLLILSGDPAIGPEVGEGFDVELVAAPACWEVEVELDRLLEQLLDAGFADQVVFLCLPWALVILARVSDEE